MHSNPEFFWSIAVFHGQVFWFVVGDFVDPFKDGNDPLQMMCCCHLYKAVNGGPSQRSGWLSIRAYCQPNQGAKIETSHVHRVLCIKICEYIVIKRNNLGKRLKATFLQLTQNNHYAWAATISFVASFNFVVQSLSRWNWREARLEFCEAFKQIKICAHLIMSCHVLFALSLPEHGLNKSVFFRLRYVRWWLQHVL